MSSSMIRGSLMKHRGFEILCFVFIDDLKCFHRNHHCFLKETSMKHQCFRDKHIKNNNDHYCLQRNLQCFIHVASLSLQGTGLFFWWQHYWIINNTNVFSTGAGHVWGELSLCLTAFMTFHSLRVTTGIQKMFYQ